MNNRLQIIVDWILKENFKIVADIGTDHGKIPIFLASTQPQMKIFATDVCSYPINRLIPKISHLKNIESKVGFGFNPIQDQIIDLVIISGMGVQKIMKIIKIDDWRKKNYIFQVGENPVLLRKWIKKQNYFIQKENIMFEKKHYYHTIFVNKEMGEKIIDIDDLIFGPILKKEKSKIFKDYWQTKLIFKKELLKLLNHQERKNEITIEVKQIEKFLTND